MNDNQRHLLGQVVKEILRQIPRDRSMGNVKTKVEFRFTVVEEMELVEIQKILWSRHGGPCTVKDCIFCRPVDIDKVHR